MLRPWARRSDLTAKRLHRAQKWSIVIAFAAILASPLFVILGPLAGLAVGGLALGASFVLTAALLGTYALRA